MASRDPAGTVTLEGTLDEFGLPGVLRLLGQTRKSGTLHVRQGVSHGVLHLSDGQLTGGRADVREQALIRRLRGTGLVDDDMLEEVVEGVHPGNGLARLLVDRAGIDAGVAARVAGEQATDAVYDLMRWTDGSFAFTAGEVDPDDLGARLPVDEVVAEAQRRHGAWEQLCTVMAGPAAVVTMTTSPAEAPRLTMADWRLLALVDGRRTVAEVVALSGLGAYTINAALSALVEQGLVRVAPGEGDALRQRGQALLARLEAPADKVPPEPVPPEPVPPEPDPPADTGGVDTVLLLRLLAGVRGL